jgi:glycosyltransferase involved in cell wall biosynthesis
VDYLVVNDGSKDRTEAICNELGLNHVSLPVNTGLTSGFKCGMKYAARHGYDAVVQFDADGQHLPEFIPAMAEAMAREGAGIVIASRILAGEAPVGARGLGSKLISWLIKATTGTTITDPTSGMRMYNRTLIEQFATSFDLAPEPDSVAMLVRKGTKVVEVPAHMQERQGGTSYLDLPNIVRYMLRTCFSILMFQWFR